MEIEEANKATAERALALANKACREGLLGLEPMIDSRKYKQRDIMEFGLRLAVDGVDPQLVDKILTNIIALETDADKKRIKMIQKEAVLAIHDFSLRGFTLALNSYISASVEEAVKKGRNL